MERLRPSWFRSAAPDDLPLLLSDRTDNSAPGSGYLQVKFTRFAPSAFRAFGAGLGKMLYLCAMDQSDIVKAQLMDERDLGRTLDRMARQIVETFTREDGSVLDVGLIGMQLRGVPIAERLKEKIDAAEGVSVPLGILDATMYRDDFRLRLKKPKVRETRIPFDITERHLVLVDDVLFTGRTARAALDALMDVGRPASVHFLVVIDRGLRELPIRADFVGRRIPTFPGEEVRVRMREIDQEEGVWLVQHTEKDARSAPNT